MNRVTEKKATNKRVIGDFFSRVPHHLPDDRNSEPLFFSFPLQRYQIQIERVLMMNLYGTVQVRLSLSLSDSYYGLYGLLR